MLWGLNSLAKDYKVNMLNASGSEVMVFKPSVLKVNVGDTVTFVPKSDAHNTKSVFLPEGAKNWNSKTSESITIKMNKEGTYIYECTNHVSMGMVGIIQVGALTDLKKVGDFIKSYKKKFILNKNRLENYLKELSE